jgi:UDP-glucose 4-epimerase
MNLALGTKTSIKQLVALISEVTSLPLQIEHSPERVGEVPHSSADPSKLHALFPCARSYSLEAVLANTFDWMRQSSGYK